MVCSRFPLWFKFDVPPGFFACKTGGIYIADSNGVDALEEQLLTCRKDVNNPNKQHRNAKDGL